MSEISAKDLRQYIVGAWTLESYLSTKSDGSDEIYPLGTDPVGILLYTADGYMSAQIMRSDRPEFRVGDLAVASKSELASAASGYLAYSGPYTVHDGVIDHHVNVSLLPNWIGGTQHRVAHAAESRLDLGPTEAVLINGELRDGRLIWRRAQPT